MKIIQSNTSPAMNPTVTKVTMFSFCCSCFREVGVVFYAGVELHCVTLRGVSTILIDLYQCGLTRNKLQPEK